MKRNGNEKAEKNLSFSGEARQNGALRIMEALSGVDEELLERAGDSAGAETECQENAGSLSETDAEYLAGAEVRLEMNAGSLEGMEVLPGTDAGVLKDAGILQNQDAEIADPEGAEFGRKVVFSEKKERHGNGRTGKKALWRYARPWAAVLCLAVAGVLGWGGYRLTRQVDENRSGGMMNDMAMKMEGQDAGMEGAAAAEEMEEAAPQDAERAEDIWEEEGAADLENRIAAGGAEEENGNGDGESGQMNSTTNSAAQQDGKEEGKAGQEMEEAVDRLSQGSTGNASGGAEGSGGNPAGEYSDTVGNPGDIPGGRPEGDLDSSGKLQGQESAGQDSASMESVEGDTDGCPPANLKKLTEKEARKQKELGQYLPEIIPQGYAFEEAFSNLDQEEANLAIIWARGLDSITWRVVKAEEAPETVDIDRPETYDLRLYEIPHAESVPREYRQTVDNPVFAWEDLSLEIVESRMMSYSDRGDTDTPRGNFGVLCQDNIVIYFSGRGTAEEIWEMFSSVEGLK